jgi:ectoine hydroxylase-related dioxygenase (phytanoyl-CoA dioxygenase family)
MLRAPTLTDDQIDTFKSDGFVVLRNGFSQDEVSHIEKWATEISSAKEESGKHWVYHETSQLDPGKDLISRIEYISPYHDGFAELADSLKAPVAQLLNEDAVLFKEKINFKLPGGDGFKPHQDSQAGWEDYANYFVSVLVCIDDATIENGCLQLVAGNHRRGLYREWEPLTDDDMKEMDFKFYPTQPGDIVFFDCYTPHASEPNLSNTTRRLYFATYNAISEGDHLTQYYKDKHDSYPPDIDREADKEYTFRV